MLIMSARRLGFVPESLSRRAAYSMASVMSELRPPPTPNARNGMILDWNAMPAIPMALLVAAAMVPEACVP